MNSVLKKSFSQENYIRVWREDRYKNSFFLFIFSGVFFLAFGIAFAIMDSKIIEQRIPYSLTDELSLNSCSASDLTNPQCCYLRSQCEKTIQITSVIKGPIFVYYELNNFYQNHRLYIQSFNSKQLSGSYLPLDHISQCDPILKNSDLQLASDIEDLTLTNGNPNQQKICFFNQTSIYPPAQQPVQPSGGPYQCAQNNMTGYQTSLYANDPATPCGLIAQTFFNDTYQLYDSQNNLIKIDETNIAWEYDKQFAKNTDQPQKQWIDMTNEHFLVWMRISGLSKFRKFWGRIHQDLQPGNYKLQINNNYNSSQYDIKKYFVMTTLNAMGGSNPILYIVYLVTGCISIVLSIVFLIFWQKQKLN